MYQQPITLFATEGRHTQRIEDFLFSLGIGQAPNNFISKANLVIVSDPRDAFLQNTIETALALGKRVIVIDAHLGWNNTEQYADLLDFEDAIRKEVRQGEKEKGRQGATRRTPEEVIACTGADAEITVPT